MIYQLKILTTAFFAVTIFKRSLHKIQWISLVILLSRVILVQLAQDGSKTVETGIEQISCWVSSQLWLSVFYIWFRRNLLWENTSRIGYFHMKEKCPVKSYFSTDFVFNLSLERRWNYTEPRIFVWLRLAFSISSFSASMLRINSCSRCETCRSYFNGFCNFPCDNDFLYIIYKFIQVSVDDLIHCGGSSCHLFYFYIQSAS